MLRSFLAIPAVPTRCRSYLRWCHARSSLYLRCFICRRRRNVVGFDYLPTRNVSVAMAFDRSFPQSLASPTSPPPSIAVHGSCLPVNSDRYGLRVERLFLPARLCFPDTVTQERCRSLRLHLHSQTLFDDSASLLCQPETSACFSEPSMPGCFTPSYISRSAFSAALGIVKQACLCSRWHENSHGSHTNGHILPTHRGRSRQHSTPSAVFYYPSATLTPPQANVRCAA